MITRIAMHTIITYQRQAILVLVVTSTAPPVVWQQLWLK